LYLNASHNTHGYSSEPQGTRTDSNPTPVFGPSIQFAGQSAQWTGDSHAFKDQVGIEARVNFETLAGDRVTSYLTIVNNGTTSIYYDWKVGPQLGCDIGWLMY